MDSSLTQFSGEDVKVVGYAGDSALIYCEDLNYLGYLINKYLSGTKRIEERCKKCIRLLQKVKTIVGSDRVLTPQSIPWIYYTVIMRHWSGL